MTSTSAAGEGGGVDGVGGDEGSLMKPTLEDSVTSGSFESDGGEI